ncbi:MAG: MFS transporter [Desulfobacterales bacterium]
MSDESTTAAMDSVSIDNNDPIEPLTKDYPKLITIAILHMAQYFPAAFTGQALPIIFRQKGLPLRYFGLLAIPGYPRWIKFIIALLVDNYGIARIGYRKTWIVPCTILGTSLYAMLAYIPPSIAAIYTIVAILFLKSFIMAAQDIAVDGYAAESMNEAERPTGTSLIVFLAVTAGVLGTAVAALVENFGWKPTMMGASLLLLGFAMPAIIRKEPPPPEASQKRRERGERPSLIKFMKRRDSWYIMPFLFGFGFAPAFGGSMFLPFLVDKGLTSTQIPILSAISALSGNGAAALTTPILISRIGLKKTALIGMCVIPIEAAVLYVLASRPQLPSLPIFITMMAVMGFGVSLYYIAVNNSRFRWASKVQSGTDYSLQSSAWNCGISIAATLAGFVADVTDWPVFFAIAGVIGTGVALSYILIFDRVEALVQQREKEELIE